MSEDRESLYSAGLERMRRFCAVNKVTEPEVKRLAPTDRLYHLATCAYYRPHTITIMVEKCAHRGYGGRAWSWPAYAIDRTPFGVVQHELGHHVDELRSTARGGRVIRHFARDVWFFSQEEPLTGYLGNYERATSRTFWMEWFAENFRLFVTNPDLSRALRPRFFAAMREEGLKPVAEETWQAMLQRFDAPPRIMEQAQKKIAGVPAVSQPDLFIA